MDKRGILFVLVLLLPLQGYAEDFVCGDTTRMTRYLSSIDPSKVTDGTCTQISNANTLDQRALVQSVAARYLKVVGGLATEMTQGEKDAVDAAIAAEAVVRQSYIDEGTTNDLCNTATLADINTRIATAKTNIQTDIDAVSNIATAKTALTTMNNAYATAFQKMARCLVARRFVR